MAHLTRLHAETQSKLRSTQILVSLPQVVSELVQNALDAQATKVEVGVDVEEWTCWVRDDGVGMSQKDLSALEGAGRYGTSKAYSTESLGEVSTFGFRGEALASAADLCCLEICSRTLLSRETWSIILKGGKTLYNGPAVRWKRESHGTVVCVRDAFYNLPIRRLSHPSPQRTLELIRKELETYSLVFPHVHFSLDNTHSNDTTRPERRRIIAIPKTSSTTATFRHIFGRALAEQVDEINESRDNMIISGFISLTGCPTKTYQYLYINRHPVTPCDLHRSIESEFASSSFWRTAHDNSSESRPPTTALRRSPRKSEKRPIYVLNITISPRDVDNCVEPTKSAVRLQNSDAVATFLKSVVRSFLVRHGFKAAPSRHATEDSPVPRKKRKIDNPKASAGTGRRSTAVTLAQPAPIVVPGENEDQKVYWTDPRTGQTFVIDQRTGNSHVLGADPTEHDDDTRPITSSGRRTLQLSSVLGSTAAPRNTEAPENTPAWIRKALEANDVYALPQTKIPTLTTHAEGFDEHGCDARVNGFRTRKQQACSYDWLDTQTQSSSFTKSDLQNARVLGQVDRKFIACVIESSVEDGNGDDDDSHDSPSTSVVLIDQHAAHERIRVERLFTQLCFATGDLAQTGPAKTSLGSPALILLTRPEAERLAHSLDLRAAFGQWGIGFGPFDSLRLQHPDDACLCDLPVIGRQVTSVVEDGGYAQVSVTSLPEILANKLLTGDHLRDLIKSYISEWDASGHPLSQAPAASQSSNNKHPHAWQKAIRRCPKNLRELINSKACRGAIMFNDELTVSQCERLVTELCETALPFQCAHGRPSLVPLARLQGVEASRRLTPVDWSNFGDIDM